MKNNKLAEYIDIAKGQDRTLGEYAKASGVNQTIISRIKSGDYRPGDKMLRKLTSEQAQPRGGVTYEMLKEACKLQKPRYALIPLDGVDLSENVVRVSMEKKNKGQEPLGISRQKLRQYEIRAKDRENQLLDEYIKSCRRFAAIAAGIIYTALARKGVRFQVANIKELEDGWQRDELVIELENCEIEKWFFTFAILTEEDKEVNKLVYDMVLDRIAKLVLMPENKRQKVSVVVNDMNLYQYLLKYKNRNSYRGFLSIIYVDAEEVIIWKEDYLSYYDLSAKENLIEVI